MHVRTPTSVPTRKIGCHRSNFHILRAECVFSFLLSDATESFRNPYLLNGFLRIQIKLEGGGWYGYRVAFYCNKKANKNWKDLSQTWTSLVTYTDYWFKVPLSVSKLDCKLLLL